MDNIKIRVENLEFSYNGKTIFQDVSLDFAENTITAITGPSGRGKSTFLTVLNRLWEAGSGAKMKGRVFMNLNGDVVDIYDGAIRKPDLRRKVGMVFQHPNPLPMSIYKNVAFPLKLTGVVNKKAVDPKVKEALEQAFLWDEVKDRLDDSAHNLSGGQQQRLCIARTLVSQPEILLLDEPTSSLDSNAATVIEDLLLSLKSRCPIIVVTYYLEQSARIADRILKLEETGFIEA